MRYSADFACAVSPSPRASSAATVPSSCGRLARDADHARALLEVVDAERRGKARGARGGQHVVRARRSSRRAPPSSRARERSRRRAGSSAAARPGFSTESSRCSGAMRLTSSHASSRSRTWISAPRFDERGGDHVAPRHRGELARHAGGDRVDERGVGRDQDRLRQLVVLGLREEIHRHPVGVRACRRTPPPLPTGPPPCRCRPRRTRAAWRRRRRHCPGPTILSTAGIVAVP